MEWANSFRLKSADLIFATSDQISDYNTQMTDLAIKDMEKCVLAFRISNPTVFLWRKFEKNGDIVYGWYIGPKVYKRRKKDGWDIYGVLKIATSEHAKKGQIFDLVKEKVLGIKKDPKKLNPYH